MEDTDLIERRRHPRHVVRVGARYWVDDERHAVRAHILDISLGGLAVQLPGWDRVDIASEAVVQLRVPGGTTTVTTPVAVQGIGGEDQPVMRMRFLDTSEVFRSLIASATQTWDRTAP